MNRVSQIFMGALALNVVILLPVVTAMLTGFPYDPIHLGPTTDGRLILTSIYASIAIVSAMLIVFHMKNKSWAVPMTVAMFCVQIVYKLITVPLVGLDNPVVMANLFVVVVQTFALWALWKDARISPALA